ncbi:MAG: cobalamin-dependent protein [Bacteroidales bacterium]|nr:cobalamin-dependent protein [Bacteroidales bacterium]
MNKDINIRALLIGKAPLLAEKIVELQYKLQSKFWKPYGSKGRMISIRDAGYHIPFLAEAIELQDPAIFTNYVAWVKKLFRGLNFPDEVMIVTLQCTDEVIKAEFPKDIYDQIHPFIFAGIEQMNKEVANQQRYIDAIAPKDELARQYIAALLSANRKKASDLVLKAVDSGIPVKDIYMNVFQKSQYEIGRLWLENKISIAKEHYCSAATQQIMSQLYHYIFDTEKKGANMVAASVGSELHEIGIRMVADFFEMDGWDTYFMGANTPLPSIISAIKENDAKVLALSVAIPYHLSTLNDYIASVREELNGSVKILIGGYAINALGESRNKINADGYAADAESAIKLANSFI